MKTHIISLGFVAIFGELLPARPLYAMSQPETEKLSALCHRNPSAYNYKKRNLACLKWCKEMRKQDITTPTADACDTIILNSEALKLGNKACSANACVYRLHTISMNLYEGNGFYFSRKELPMSAGIWGYRGVLKGPHGTGVFDMGCGTACQPWQHVSGAYKNAKINLTESGVTIRLSTN